MGLDVDKIFFTVEDPDLTVMFGQQQKRYNKRTSSACAFVVPPTQGRCEPVNGQIRLKQTETENEIIR